MTKKNYNDLIEKLVLKGSLVAILLTTPLAFCISNERYKRFEEAAREVSHQYYIPAGNGGSFGEFYGHISPQRQKMYDKIKRVYNQRMNCCIPEDVIREAEIFKDPNLTKEQKAKRIRDLYGYIQFED